MCPDERPIFTNKKRECPTGDLQWECRQNLLDERELYQSRLVSGGRGVSAITAFQWEVSSGEQEW